MLIAPESSWHDEWELDEQDEIRMADYRNYDAHSAARTGRQYAIVSKALGA